jgi:RimJ/RimL family protein N-acetyltransferase
MQIRAATMEDAQRLFAWRNDALTREMSISQDLVTWECHLAWLGKRLARTEPHLYIVEKDGTPVATYRIDGNDEVSYTVAPEFRRQGVATALLGEALTRHGPLKAEIFRDNLGSIKAAERAGVRIVCLERVVGTQRAG